jgi:hypothetical protein
MTGLLSRRALLWAAVRSRNIRITAKKHQVRVEAGSTLSTSFHFGEQWAKPFLYPIVSPKGIVLSRGFPLEHRANESTDHKWHRGMWIGHGLINGHDFWREQTPETTGRLRVTGEVAVRRSGFSVMADLVPPAGSKRLGSLIQEWEFGMRPRGFVIDVAFTWLANAEEALHFGDTDDGGFGFRLRDEFREDRGAILSSDSGARGTKMLWGKPAKWIDYSAVVDGRAAGVTMYDHPGNFRYPTEWHARPYGLNAANPFASRSFRGSGVPSGDYTIPRGGKLQLRYRVLWHDGWGESLRLSEEAPQ